MKPVDTTEKNVAEQGIRDAVALAALSSKLKAATSKLLMGLNPAKLHKT